MNRNYFYVILVLTIFCLFLIVFFLVGNETKKENSEETRQEVQQEVQIDRPPFQNYISGVGVVEPASGNIGISSPYNRLVERIYVAINDKVKKGQTLFQLNNKDLIANLRGKQKKYESALANFHKLEAYPREEDLTIAVETLNKAAAEFNQAKIQYCMSRSCSNKAVACLNWYKYQEAEAQFREAEAQFDKVKAGTWAPDLNVAYFEVETAQADVEAMKTEIAETYIKSPIDGTILQLKLHEGETVIPNKTVIIVGNIDALNLRVSIDQYIEEMFHENARAVAFRQGDHKTEFPLQFLHIEPIMTPKTTLTNDLQERVDTHVFEILYRIEKDDERLFVGEQMDVYIENSEL